MEPIETLMDTDETKHYSFISKTGKTYALTKDQVQYSDLLSALVRQTAFKDAVVNGCHVVQDENADVVMRSHFTNV